MIITNGLDISGTDYFGRREDLSFIVRFQWKTSNHLKEAIQVLLASRLDDGIEAAAKTARRRSDVLDESEFEQIRMQIASNPNTPPAVLDYLARNSGVRVLERIAENPRTAQQTLERLAFSPWPVVRAAVVENVSAPAEILNRLVADHDVDVRYRLAENPHLDAEVLGILATDSNPYVSSRATATLGRVNGGTVVSGDFRERAARSSSSSQSVSAT